MVVGFVVVAIEQHQIATGQQRVGHHLVGRRGAVEHKVGFIGVEHPRRVLLRILGRPFVDQQIAQLDVGVAHIGTEQGLTVEIEELPAGRVFAEELAALMPRAGEGRIFHLDVGLQRFEERRQQRLLVGVGGGLQLCHVERLAGAGQQRETPLTNGR